MTGSGKSFQLGVKFFFKVFNAPESDIQFVIAASSVGQVEKMVIQKKTSFYNMFKPVLEHKPAGVGGNQIIVHSPTGDKIIYLVGYDDKKRFQTILGLDIKGFLLEEAHIAGEAFVREMFTRVYRNQAFLYTSSNGGLPDLITYRDYLNKARPNPNWEHEVPDSTLEQLKTSEPDNNFEFWYYRFEDNPVLTAEQIKDMYSAHPVGSFEYNSKILGIRGFVEGMIYAKYLNASNLVQFKDVYQNQQSEYPFMKYSIGIDVGSTDFTVFTLVGFTRNYKHAIVLSKVEINHAGVNEIWDVFTKWYDPFFKDIGYRVHGAFIDSAAQILKSSLAPLLMGRYGMSIADSFKYTIKERVDWGIRFIYQDRLLFTEHTKETYDAFNNTLYKKNLHETDIREFPKHIYKDRIDSCEYAITPFIQEMLRAV